MTEDEMKDLLQDVLRKRDDVISLAMMQDGIGVETLAGRIWITVEEA